MDANIPGFMLLHIQELCVFWFITEHWIHIQHICKKKIRLYFSFATYSAWWFLGMFAMFYDIFDHPVQHCGLCHAYENTAINPRLSWKTSITNITPELKEGYDIAICHPLISLMYIVTTCVSLSALRQNTMQLKKLSHCRAQHGWNFYKFTNTFSISCFCLTSLLRGCSEKAVPNSQNLIW